MLDLARELAADRRRRELDAVRQRVHREGGIVSAQGSRHVRRRIQRLVARDARRAARRADLNGKGRHDG